MTSLHEPARRDLPGHGPARSASRRPLALALALAALTTSASAVAQPVGIMTYNQYFGADISRLTEAPPEAFNATLVDVLRTIAASRFPDRAALQARSIAQNRPDFVALQEVWRLACVNLAAAPAGRGCTDPAIAGAFNDQLEVTLAALAALGVNYSTAALVTNFRIDGTEGIPFVVNGFPALLQFADRDVILVNNQTTSDVQPVTFPSPPCRPSDDGCNYNVVLRLEVTVPVPGSDDEITLETGLERGFVAVDATVREKRYRFVNTHLEVKNPPVPAEIQCAQAAELSGILAATTPTNVSLLLAGDFNSGPDDVPLPGVLPTPDDLPELIEDACFGDTVVPPYLLLTQAGLSDVWTYRTGAGARRSPRADGYTCCQTETLRNNNSRLNDRIDLIFSAAPPTIVQDTQVVGDTVPEKTFPYGRGIWPSDHGGVVARLQLGTSVALANTARARPAAMR